MSQDFKTVSEMPFWFKKRLWPNLEPSNYELTSEPTTDYNCVSWALNIKTEPIDLSLDEEGEPLLYPDLSSLPYIEFFQTNGFELCDTSDFEEGYEKIALYERSDRTFEHVARLVSEGIWTSKLGEWEDIQHTSLETLENPKFYGVPCWFMKRIIG